jgi:hypothetical protein
MQIRSWTATLVLVAGTTALLGLAASAQKTSADQASAEAGSPVAPKPAIKPAETSPSRDAKSEASRMHCLELNLIIAGLGQQGCEIEVKPGNRGCRFQAQRKHVGAKGEARFLFKDIELRGAEHNCTFAITLEESKQAPRTIYRGFRVIPRGTTGASTVTSAIPSFTCYMNAPSKLARLEHASQIRQ